MMRHGLPFVLLGLVLLWMYGQQIVQDLLTALTYEACGLIVRQLAQANAMPTLWSVLSKVANLTETRDAAPMHGEHLMDDVLFEEGVRDQVVEGPGDVSMVQDKDGAELHHPSEGFQGFEPVLEPVLDPGVSEHGSRWRRFFARVFWRTVRVRTDLKDQLLGVSALPVMGVTGVVALALRGVGGRGPA